MRALAALLGLSGVSVAVFDADLRYLLVSGSAAGVAGVDDAEVEGRLIAEVQPREWWTEAGRDRYPSYRALAADAGQSPVAKESGKSRRAQFRWACDHRLREAFNTLSDSSRHHNPWANDIYTRARERGASHAHAARILGRSWTQIIWRLWQDHDTYQPTKHTARQRLLAAEG